MTETVELTAELLVDGAEPVDPVISPDGRLVAYAISTTEGKRGRLRTLWVAPADASSPPRTLAHGPGLTGPPRWAPDSGSLVVVADGQLHRISLAGGDPVVLTRWRGHISGQLPLADGRLAVLATDEPDEADERRKADGDDALVWGQDIPCNRLLLLDPAAGDLRRIGALGDRHVVELEQRPDGGPLAVISWACPHDEPGAFTAVLHLVDPARGQTRELGPAGWTRARPRGGTTAPTGTWPTWPSPPRPGRRPGRLRRHRTRRRRSRQWPSHSNLTAGMDVCPVELAQVAGGPPLALFADGLDTALYRLDPGAQRFRQCPPGRAASTRSPQAATGRRSRCWRAPPTSRGMSTPGRQAARWCRISDARPEARRIRWGTQERLSYQASDGLALDGLLILPPGRNRADGPFPLITLVHGGPYGRWADRFLGSWWAPGQWLAAAGNAVFLPNPRGGQGHGHEFAAMVSGAVGTDEWTDLLRGIDLLVADGVADPDRLGIGGWSHGGFTAAWAVGQTHRFKAALMGAGISDWGMQVGVGELGTWEAGLGGSCGWESPGPHRHHQLSPISYASKVRTPVLIVHGQDDTNVPMGQAVYFHRALSRYGVEHELVIYPREGHTFTERQHQIDLLRRTRAWFARWLDAPAPGT